MTPSGFFVVAPSTVAIGEEFNLCVKALGEPYYVGAGCYQNIFSVRSRYNHSPRGIRYMDNVLPEWSGLIAIDGTSGFSGPSEFSFEGKSGPYPGDTRPIARISGCVFHEPGMQFITIRDFESDVSQVSNPICVSAEPLSERLFWGDIHSQTFFSDGLRCPEELYAFARDEAFLDIFALADHSEQLTDRQWEYFVNVTNDYNTSGAFATLVGLEWTSGKWGHRNVYYPGDWGPALRCNDPIYGQLENLYSAAREHGALVIPHHSANVTMGVDWSLGHDSEVERLAEIYSVWGNSERPAHAGNPRPIRTLGGEKDGQHILDALARGHRYGLVGGGDIHDGRPGDDLHQLQEQPQEYRNLWRQGIMGVWAKELTRAAIFEALWNRNVFATTNVRTYLTFSVCDAPMGSEIHHDSTRVIRVHAASEVPFATIELVRNGEDIRRIEPQQREITWEVKDLGSGGTDWYYVRLTRQDGEMAWSSPVWVS